MSFCRLAYDDPDGFERMCARLRKLGVVKLGPLVLGVEPREAAKVEPPDPQLLAMRRHQVMFAASSIRPPMPAPPPKTGGEPRAVVQRRARDEAARGTRTSRQG